ncbi:MAG: 30S ribosomal protein S24e [Candidatus Aenigmatarchaeota archaeon]
MEITVLKEKDNQLLKRKEILLELSHLSQPTPKKEEVKEKVASLYNVEKDRVFVQYIFTKKGIPKSIAKVKIEEGKVETQTS